MPSTPIAEIDPNFDIASHEGMSIDHVSRARLAYLIGQNNSLVQQTQFADAKAGALLAVIGLVATRWPSPALGGEAVSAGTVFFLTLHAAVLIACLVVLVPRFVGRDARRALARRERFSWPSLVTEDEQEEAYPGFMRTAEMSQLVISVARSNLAVAAILHRKFACLRFAFLLAAVDLALLAFASVFGIG